MTLHFVRHTSVKVPTGICYGQSDVDVADTFAQEAMVLYERFSDMKFDVIYSSPLRRCMQLARFCGYPHFISDDRLMEMHFGKWELQPWDDIDDDQLWRWFDDWVNERTTGGESFALLIERVKNFIEEVKRLPVENILIFTHAGVVRAAGAAIGKYKPQEAFQISVAYGQCVTFEV